MVVQLRCMAFLNKIYSPRSVEFCPSISESSVGTPFFISFLGFTYIELQQARHSFFGGGVHFKLEGISCQQSLKYISLYNTGGAPFSTEKRNIFLCT